MTEVPLRFRSFIICYLLHRLSEANLYPFSYQESHDSSCSQERGECLEVSTCHFVPLHAQALASISNLIARKILFKRAEIKSRLTDETGRPGYSISAPSLLPSSSSPFLSAFFPFVTHSLSRREGEHLTDGGLACILVFSSRCYHILLLICNRETSLQFHKFISPRSKESRLVTKTLTPLGCY